MALFCMDRTATVRGGPLICIGQHSFEDGELWSVTDNIMIRERKFQARSGCPIRSCPHNSVERAFYKALHNNVTLLLAN